MDTEEKQPEKGLSCIKAIKMTDDILNYRAPIWHRFSKWLEENWPFSAYVIVSSSEEYYDLPWNEKTVWGIFYKEHILHKDDIMDWGSKKHKEEDERIDTFKEYKWPIQYLIREKFRMRWWPRYVKDFWYEQIDSRIDPRQAYLTKVIPRTWADKTSLIPEVNFAMVKHFVDKDGEDCFNSTDYEGSSEGHTKFAKELRECYDYITFSRPILQKQLDNSYPDPDTRTGDYHIDYAEHDKLEKMIDECDTKWLVWIVTNRDYFWT